jgi:uncharacterized membrane protein
MSTVVASVDVEVPVETAYNQWTQFETFPSFMGGVESVRQVDDRHLHWKARIGAVRREFDTEITEQRPDERIAWRSTDGRVRTSGVVLFCRIDDHACRVNVHLTWEAKGLVEHVAGALGLDRRRVRADLSRFKAFIQERGRETGRWRGTVSSTDQ